jgi:tripartite-type tricarboxylate transporter receptor subunit TctC
MISPHAMENAMSRMVLGFLLEVARLSGSRATRDSLPPCGGGSGWRVAPRGTAVPHPPTPTPNPFPQGGGETSAGPLRRNLAPLGLLIALATISPAIAQEWPTRTITLVVPFTPGGGVDISARLQAQAIGEILGQSVIVENIGGGAGMTAGVRVAHAAPDGYTFMIGNTGTHAYNQSLYKKPLYNSVTDFTSVGLVSESPRILNARKDLPVNGLQEFISWLKANEKTAQFGSAGVGTGTHLPCVLFNLAIGVNITHVPYRGAGPVIQDLIGGRIDYMCDTIQTGAQLAKQGTLKPIAVLSPRRVAIVPEIPTAAEQGLAGVEASVWNAFFLPKGTPDSIVRKLNAAVNQSLENPVLRKRLEELGLEIVPAEQRTPEYLARFLPEDIERWAKPIRAAGISAD